MKLNKQMTPLLLLVLGTIVVTSALASSRKYKKYPCSYRRHCVVRR